MRAPLDVTCAHTNRCLINDRRFLVHRISVSIDLVHFAQIQLPHADLDLTHVSHDHPYQMVRQDVFLGDLIGALRRESQRLLCEGVVVVFRQAVLNNVPVGPA